MKNYAIIDKRMSLKCKTTLINEGFELIQVSSNPNLDIPISSHPDIFVFKYKNTLICEPNTGNMLEKHLFDLEEKRFNFILGDIFSTATKYPNDCTYNFAVCGKHLIGNIKCADKGIKDLANYEALILIDTKQGYAKCNICVVNDNAIITEDKGIARTCKNFGIDVLLLETNSVKLNGYQNGFIGGASGNYNNKLYFCGNIEKHPEYKKIYEFCKMHSTVPVSLSDEDLYDYGSIIIL